MSKIYRIKKTGQVVHKMYEIDSMHTMMLFPLQRQSRKGNWGVCQPVRNDRLVFETNEPRMATRQ